jgi:hypothetical protein
MCGFGFLRTRLFRQGFWQAVTEEHAHPVALLQLIPLHESELHYARENGTEILEELLDQAGMRSTGVVDYSRAPVV